MNLLPVIHRELRASARQPFTYNLRLLGVLALLAVGLYLQFSDGLSAGRGAKAFGSLHLTLFCAIWLLVPLLAVDAISRERREGTLPLLFLTPLRPREIVLAKGLAHSLRAFALWLAVLPIMAIPFLLGGIGWREGVLSLAVNLSAIFLALSASLAASSICRDWSRAMLLALLLCGLLAVLLAVLHTLAVFFWVVPFMGGGRRPGFFWHLLEASAQLIFDSDGCWSSGLVMMPPAGRRVWLLADAGLVLTSLICSDLLIRVAAWRLKRCWREEPLSPRAERIARVFFTPIFWNPSFRRWSRSKLEANPIGWVEGRRWSGRVVASGWLVLVIMVSIGALALGRFYDDVLEPVRQLLLWVLLRGLAMTAARSFRHERETGIIELLLVAPLGEWRIIGGRVRALWGRFLPGLLVLFAVWSALSLTYHQPEQLQLLPYFAIVYVTVPIIGLYFSLARNTFLPAFLWTLFIGVLVPLLMTEGSLSLLFNSMGNDPSNLIRSAPEVIFGLAMPFLLAFTFAMLLHHNLARRKFALG